jgi:hypothetical protein
VTPEAARTRLCEQLIYLVDGGVVLVRDVEDGK